MVYPTAKKDWVKRRLLELKTESIGFIHELSLAQILGLPFNTTKGPHLLMFDLFREIKTDTKGRFNVFNDRNLWSTGIKWTAQGTKVLYKWNGFTSPSKRSPRWFSFKDGTHTILKQIELKEDLERSGNATSWFQRHRWNDKKYHEFVCKHWPVLRSHTKEYTPSRTGRHTRDIESVIDAVHKKLKWYTIHSNVDIDVVVASDDSSSDNEQERTDPPPTTTTALPSVANDTTPTTTA